jgi:glyoxylase-like metal-dependent hydrolase (beta-lactamase superfamily II)
MHEHDLARLGIHRIPIPVPFPQAGGPVNVYLVEEEAGGGVMMFDAGLGTPEAVDALERGFAQAGRRFDEVTRIVLSHGHVDHYGAALTVIERAGHRVPVFVHAADQAKVAESGRRWRDLAPLYGAYLLRLGVPAEVFASAARNLGVSHGMARRIPEVTPLEPGTVLRTRHLSLEVVHMPGHTPGMVCLHDRRERLALSADHLLEKVSPNPIIDLGPNGEEGHFQPLVSYLASIARMREMEIDLVLPGHGPPFQDHRRVIDALLAFYVKRHARIREALASGPRTAYEIAQALFPSARPGDVFLVLSETIANVEVLEGRGEIARERDGEVYRFRLAA